MFNRSWNSFMLSRDLDPMPAIFNRNPMDLYRLFKYVALSGGHEKVTGHKLWAKIGRAFNPPTSMTDLSYQVKKIYMAKLAAYEEAYHQNAVGYAIDAQESFVDSLESGARLPPTLKKRKLTPGTNIRAAKDSGWTVGSSQSPQAAALRRVVPLASGSKIDSPDESLATATQVFTTTGGCAGFEIFTFFPGVTLDEIKVRCWPSGHVVLRVQPQQADRSGLEETLILPLGSGQCLDTSNAQALFTSEGRLYVRVNIA